MGIDDATVNFMDPVLTSQSTGWSWSLLGSVHPLRTLVKHAKLERTSHEQGTGNDLEQRENQAAILIMHSVLVQWN